MDCKGIRSMKRRRMNLKPRPNDSRLNIREATGSVNALLHKKETILKCIKKTEEAIHHTELEFLQLASLIKKERFNEQAPSNEAGSPDTVNKINSKSLDLTEMGSVHVKLEEYDSDD